MAYDIVIDAGFTEERRPTCVDGNIEIGERWLGATDDFTRYKSLLIGELDNEETMNEFLKYETHLNAAGEWREGFNKKGLHVCLIGNLDSHDMTEKQKEALIYAIKRIIQSNKFPNLKEDIIVIGHREIPGVKKSCPGSQVDMQMLRYNIKKTVERVEPSIADVPEEKVVREKVYSVNLKYTGLTRILNRFFNQIKWRMS